MLKARKYGTKRYTTHVVEEAMNKLPMDIAWVLQSIISATNTEDVANVVDAFVTGVKSVTERVVRSENNDTVYKEQVIEGTSEVKKVVSPEENGSVIKGVGGDNSKNDGGDSGTIDGDLHSDRLSTGYWAEREVIEPYKGAKAIIEGMTGAPELNNVKESILAFDFDTSDVHSIMYLGTAQYITDEAKKRVFRGESGDALEVVVSRYNKIMLEKLQSVTKNVTLGNRDILIQVLSDTAEVENKRVIYDKSAIKSFADFVTVLCDCAKIFRFTDYVIYSTGSALKLKGLVNGHLVVMVLRIVAYSHISDESLMSCSSETLQRVTCGVKMPKIVDALK